MKEFVNGIWKNNPVLFLMLGLCPTLAVTTSVLNAIGMGVATIFVLLGSGILISLLRKLIPEEVRIPSFIVIIATFVTIVYLYMQAFLPSLASSLGLYLMLIVVNCIVLGRALAFAYKNPVIPTIKDSLGMGIGFLLALIIISAIRELIGTGALLGYQIFNGGVLIMVLPPGALLVMGLILGIKKWRSA